MSEESNYEAVIGLEIHVQLSTATKLFCGDSVSFGQEPNNQVSAISLAHPGTLPKTNTKAVAFAVKMGLACNCSITHNNFFARKNYFYPDLPKGYQTSQHTVPICNGGFVEITTEGNAKSIILNRIHLEEDAGKSIHDVDEKYSLIDLNRAGTVLIEIVTEPCIHTAEDACQYVLAIRKLVRWLDISDGDMEKGNLRCDANISIRPKGETALGTKVEVKNLNSIRNLRKAIEFEIERMTTLLQIGERIVQQTRSFDAITDTTFALRDKEEANDYRYFPDPDIAPFKVSSEFIQKTRWSMPELPHQLVNRFQSEFQLSQYDAVQLTEDRDIADFFLEVRTHSQNQKSIANWINGPLKQQLKDRGGSISSLGLNPERFAELILLVDDSKISFSVASSKVLPLMIISGRSASEIVEELNLLQVNDEDELSLWINEALNNMPDKVAEYKKGKKGLIGLFVGEVKKLSKGKADPKIVNDILERKLNN